MLIISNFQLKYLCDLPNGQEEIQVVAVRCFLGVSKHGLCNCSSLSRLDCPSRFLDAGKDPSTLKKEKTNLSMSISALIWLTGTLNKG